MNLYLPLTHFAPVYPSLQLHFPLLLQVPSTDPSELQPQSEIKIQIFFMCRQRQSVVAQEKVVHTFTIWEIAIIFRCLFNVK